ARSTSRRAERSARCEVSRALLNSRLWQGRQQMAEAQARLAHVEALLDFPNARRHRMHHRHLQVLLQGLDDIESAPTGAEHVDRIGALGLEEVALDVGIDLMA